MREIKKDLIKENDEFILDIKRLGINGEGVGFYNRMAVFVDGAIPGEGHDVVVTKVDGKMAYAKTKEIKHQSPYRKQPECPYFDICGGCSIMHIDYEESLKLKRELVIEALNRYTKINTKQFEIKQTVKSDYPFAYRNKEQLYLKKDNNQTKVCMIRPNSNITFPIDKCLIEQDLINEINPKILKLIDDLKIDLYDKKSKSGLIKQLVIRQNKDREALVCFIVSNNNEKLKTLAKEVIKIKGVKSVYININKDDKSIDAFGKETIHLEGEKYLVEKIGKIKYQIYPTTFFQLNSYQAEKLYDIVLKNCKLSFKERVLDAYCGVGTIGLYLAHMAKEVIGVEYNKEAVLAANENSKLNNIKNAKFLQGDATELLPRLIENETFDVLVVDPPRTGLEEKFINAILESGIKKIIYVSCNPATLAKNLEILKQKYNINSITPVDMFSQTAHVETVVSMTHK